jgi:hypothetical protein
MMRRFNGAEAWQKLDPIAQQMIGAIALEFAMADRSVGVVDAADFPALRALEHASTHLSAFLRDACVSALGEDVGGPDAPLAVPTLIGDVCRGCGCSEHDACEGGCSFIEPDLCSTCAFPPEEA